MQYTDCTHCPCEYDMSCKLGYETDDINLLLHGWTQCSTSCGLKMIDTDYSLILPTVIHDIPRNRTKTVIGEPTQPIDQQELMGMYSDMIAQTLSKDFLKPYGKLFL